MDSFDPERLHARKGLRCPPRFFSSAVRSSAGFKAADEAGDEEDEDDEDDELDELDEELEDDDGTE